MRSARYSLPILLLFWASTSVSIAVAQPLSLQATLNQLVKQGRLVGAQAIVGQRDRILIKHVAGRTLPGSGRVVDENTQFCIGSCSKPFAAAVVMSMAEDRLIRLDRPIDGYLPDFETVLLPDGRPSDRAPNMKELLAHRGGIYSQKEKLSPRQLRWIRDFGLTLEQSVEGIAHERLISRPGEQYAYSGAGYCIVGRVAEVVGGASIDQLLQDRIASPLGLDRTTFFPDREDDNVAAGGINGLPNPSTPHLAKPSLRFALVGGSLYSTARESSRFLRMVANRGQLDGKRVLTDRAWTYWTSRPYPSGNYGFGWTIATDPSNPKRVVLSHNGSLASSRSTMKVALQSGLFAVVHYTVARNPRETEQGVRSAIDRELRRLSTRR